MGEPRDHRRSAEERQAEATAYTRDWIKRVLIASAVFLLLAALGVVDAGRDLVEQLTGWRPGG